MPRVAAAAGAGKWAITGGLQDVPPTPSPSTAGALKQELEPAGLEGTGWQSSLCLEPFGVSSGLCPLALAGRMCPEEGAQMVGAHTVTARDLGVMFSTCPLSAHSASTTLAAEDKTGMELAPEMGSQSQRGRQVIDKEHSK